MLMLIAGLVLFLGVHSSRVFADDARSAFIAAHGEKTWKGIYAVLSIVGFVLVVYGYGEARTAPLEHRSMKALVKAKAEPGIWMEEIPEPKVGPNDVLIKIDKTAICRLRPTQRHQGQARPPDAARHQALGRRASAGERQCRRRAFVRRISGLGDPVLSSRQRP